MISRTVSYLPFGPVNSSTGGNSGTLSSRFHCDVSCWMKNSNIFNELSMSNKSSSCCFLSYASSIVCPTYVTRPGNTFIGLVLLTLVIASSKRLRYLFACFLFQLTEYTASACSAASFNP